MVNIGRNLILLRFEKRLSQQKTARLAGMSQPNYCRIESGLQQPTLNQIEALAQALGVTPGQILSTEKPVLSPQPSPEAIKVEKTPLLQVPGSPVDAITIKEKLHYLEAGQAELRSLLKQILELVDRESVLPFEARPL